jgi:hypothetical protein
MYIKKETVKFIITVDGETELWYFNHLQQLIKSSSDSCCYVNFDIKKKTILKHTKSLPPICPDFYFHICDYESNDPIHTAKFNTMLKEYKKAKLLRKDIKYQIGYSNFTFELWMILHKIDYFELSQHRDHYKTQINKAYNKNFQFIDDYKKQDEFNKILNEITLEDIQNAIIRAKKIRNNNSTIGIKNIEYSGFTFYKENPDLTIHECVEIVLEKCGLLPATRRKK